MKKTIILIIIIIFTTGCYDYREVDQLAIVDSLGIDYKDNEFLISAQVLGTEKTSESDLQQMSILYTSKGKTLADAIYNLNLEYPKYIYLGHLSLIVIGKDLAQTNISKIFEYLIRDPHVREESLVIASTTNTAFEILNQKTESDLFPSKTIISIIENSSKYEGSTIETNLQELSKNFLEEGTTPVISTIELIENESNEKSIQKYNILKLNNISIIKDNKIVDTLSKEESIAYNIINNSVNTTMLEINFKDKISVIEIHNIKSDVNLKINENKINLAININLEGNIAETISDINVKSKKVLDEYNKGTNKKIKLQIEDLINKSISKNYDLLNLKSLLYKNYPKKYNEYKNKNILNIANISINVKSNVYKEGNIYSEEHKHE